METIGQRIRAERERQEMTQEELAIAAGVRKQAISAIEVGQTRNPKHETIVAISQALGVSTVWLTKGTGKSSRVMDAVRRYAESGADAVVVTDREAVAPSETLAGYVRLPLLSMEGDMGYGSHDDSPIEVVRYLDVAEWWARQNLPHRLDRVKVISSRGDSMAGVINHGDVVFVDTGIDHFEGEGLYVFNFQGRALIKRLAANLRTGKLQIQSSNPAYPPEDIEPGELDELHIAGRVAAWWTLRHS